MFSVLRVPRYQIKKNIKIDTVNSNFYQTQVSQYAVANTLEKVTMKSKFSNGTERYHLPE